MEHLANGGNVVTLRRFVADFPREMPAELPPSTVCACILDTETTGVEAGDPVIEVAVLPFLFDAADGKILVVLPALGGLQDPGFPIPAEASKVNGIFDDDVKGKTIAWGAIAQMMAACDIIIAHNAGFDRPKVSREIASRADEIGGDIVDKANAVIWACSLQQLPWEGMPARRQEILAAWHGFFYAAHRATEDCEALLHLLDVSCNLAPLWQASQRPSYEVWAVGSAFATKDMIKARGYRWYADQKTWVRAFDSIEGVEEERGWLAQNVYGRANNPAEVRKIEPQSRFR